MVSFQMHQPLGFRTSYRPKDFDEESEFAPGAAPPAVVLTSPPTVSTRLGGVTVESYEQAQIVQVNDNRGTLFPLRTMPDGSVVVPDQSLYPVKNWSVPAGTTDGHIAIGEVRTTDMLLVRLTEVAVPTGVVSSARSHLPAGRAAFWSLAEALRVACQAQFDVDPQELVVGLRPVKRHDTPSYEVFIADALENGAGYAAEIGRPEVFRSILDTTRHQLATRWSGDKHDTCTASCPDCLRSYDNRRLHGFLDWRLALDMLTLAAGDSLDAEVWFKRGRTLARGFTATDTSTFAHHDIGGLPVVVNTESRIAVVLGHPLWRREPYLWTDLQKSVQEEVANSLDVSRVLWTDPYEMDRLPLTVLRLLTDYGAGGSPL
jgi:DEAD/DEAH box helicase domain-containing protein